MQASLAPSMLFANRCLRIASIFIVLCALAAPSAAQVVGATLSGTVTDSSRAVVRKAQVTVTAVERGVTCRGPTNATGLSRLPSLGPGPDPAIRAAPGFATVQQ